MKMSFPGYAAGLVVIELRVFPLIGQGPFLALFMSRARASFSAPSGFSLNGPGFRRPDDTGEVLTAVYPEIDGMAPPAASLDRKPA